MQPLKFPRIRQPGTNAGGNPAADLDDLRSGRRLTLKTSRPDASMSVTIVEDCATQPLLEAQPIAEGY